MQVWKRALVRIVERSHPDCRKRVRRSFRFNRVTGNQDRQPALPFHRPGYLDKAPVSRVQIAWAFVESWRADSPCLRMARSRNYPMLQKSLMVCPKGDSVAVMRFAAEAGDGGAAEGDQEQFFYSFCLDDVDPG
jgi:hypothetical protein